MTEMFQASKPIVPVRGVHLDLKGVPPTFERLMGLLKLFVRARYNAILVEWEDMFPWTVDERFRSETAYTPGQVRQFAAAAKQAGLEIIPLVQCLGHMETPLSVRGYEKLRERQHLADCLNPLADGARELVVAMVEDVLKLLPDVKRFHLGGDEAWSFGQHPDTKAYIETHGKGALYLHHVEPILDRLNARGVRPILWSDMMHDWPTEPLKAIGQKADLCPWGYTGHPDSFTYHSNSKYIARFHEHGVPLWGAACYKGAGPHDGDVPDLKEQQINALGWAEVSQRYGLKGVFATGWSRYNTSLVQCYPTDASLDAIVLVAACLYDGKAPEQPAEACQAVLKEVGELERFSACKATMEKLTDVRNCAWREIKSLREQIVTETEDPRRRHSGQCMSMLTRLHHHLDKGGVQAIAMTRQAFAGLIDELWIERYLNERLAPLFGQMAELDQQVKLLEPGAYAAFLAAK